MTADERLRIRIDEAGRSFLAGEVVEVDHAVADLLGAGPQAPGTLRLDGRDVSRWDPARRVRAGLVVLGEVVIAPDVSIADHLAVVDRVRAAEVLRDAPLLAGRGDDLAGWLSGGERQVLGWLTTILQQPSVVLLDVAGRGLDQPTLRWAGDVVTGWAAERVAVLVHAGRPEEEAWLPSERSDAQEHGD